MARNPGGTVSGFKLLSTPDAPTISSVTTSIGSASVAFTAPTDVGDAAVSSYVVTAVDESTGASTGGTGSASPITVTPPAGGTFKIRMQALNAYGPGRLTEYDTGNVVYSGAELYAWGYNGSGRLGDGTVVNRSSPVQIGSLTDWAHVAAGERTSLSIKTDGTLWTWGSNASGALGFGDPGSPKSSPVQVGALTNWSTGSVGDDSCVAIKTDNTMWGWGRNNFGQVGDNTIVNKSSPVQIGALTTWSQASAGRFHFAAIKTDNTLWTWGFNLAGGLGDGTVVYRSSPVQVGTLTNWAQVSASSGHTAAVKTDNTLWAWGAGTNGRLGDGTIVNKSSPVQIGALTNWSQVSAGRFHTAAIKTDGTLWSWGSNDNGQLGDGTVVDRSSPVQVGVLTNWSKVSGCNPQGNGFTGAIKTDGTLWMWGNDDGGRLGNNTVSIKRSSPVQIGARTDWLNLSLGTSHTLALYGVV